IRFADISGEPLSHRSVFASISVRRGGGGLDEVGQVLIAKASRRSDLEKSHRHEACDQLRKENGPPPQRKERLDSGCLILCESYGGLWTQDDRRPQKNQSTIILSSSEKIVREFKKPLKLGHRWYCSERMSFNSALRITAGKGVSES